ncbi:CDCA5 [Lemmus lemmus]
MLERRTRSGGATQRLGIRTPLTKSSKRSQRKSGSDLPNIFPEIWPKTPHVAQVRKPIVLKKIVAHAVEVPSAHFEGVLGKQPSSQGPYKGGPLQDLQCPWHSHQQPSAVHSEC